MPTGFFFFHIIGLAAVFGGPWALMDWLQARHGISEMTAFGICYMPVEMAVMGSLALASRDKPQPSRWTVGSGALGALLLIAMNTTALREWDSWASDGDAPLRVLGIVVGLTAAVIYHWRACAFVSGGLNRGPIPIMTRLTSERLLLGLEVAFVITGFLMLSKAPDEGLAVIAIFGGFGAATVASVVRTTGVRRAQSTESNSGGTKLTLLLRPGVAAGAWSLAIGAALLGVAGDGLVAARVCGAVFVAVGVIALVASVGASRARR